MEQSCSYLRYKAVGRLLLPDGEKENSKLHQGLKRTFPSFQAAVADKDEVRDSRYCSRTPETRVGSFSGSKESRRSANFRQHEVGPGKSNVQMFQRAEKNDESRTRAAAGILLHQHGGQAASSRTVSDVRVFVPPMYTTQGRPSAHEAWMPRGARAQRTRSEREDKEERRGAQVPQRPHHRCAATAVFSRSEPGDRSADQDRRCLAARSHLRLQSRGGAKRRSSQEKERQCPQHELCEEGSGAVDAIIFEAWPARSRARYAGWAPGQEQQWPERSRAAPPLHGPHPGCPGTSTSGEAPVPLSFLTVPRRYIYILLRSPTLHTGAA